MEYLHGFTVTVLVVAFLCFFCESLAPEGSFGRYITLVTGLVISLAIVHAFLQIRTFEFESISMPELDAQSTQVQEDEMVTAQFAEKLADAVEKRVQETFGAEICVQAFVSCTDSVLTVEKLCVTNTQISEAVLTAFVKEEFGIAPEYV